MYFTSFASNGHITNVNASRFFFFFAENSMLSLNSLLCDREIILSLKYTFRYFFHLSQAVVITISRADIFSRAQSDLYSEVVRTVTRDSTAE